MVGLTVSTWTNNMPSGIITPPKGLSFDEVFTSKQTLAYLGLINIERLDLMVMEEFRNFPRPIFRTKKKRFFIRSEIYEWVKKNPDHNSVKRTGLFKKEAKPIAFSVVDFVLMTSAATRLAI